MTFSWSELLNFNNLFTLKSCDIHDWLDKCALFKQINNKRLTIDLSNTEWNTTINKERLTFEKKMWASLCLSILFFITFWL